MTRSLNAFEQHGRMKPASISRWRMPPVCSMSTFPETSFDLQVPHRPLPHDEGMLMPDLRATESSDWLLATTPSRFHRFGADGQPNPKWQGATPKDAHAYLRAQWTRIRAAWHRQGISPYGFRVAEPHHDGFPHWHLLLFVPPEQVGWFTPRRYDADRQAAGRGMLGIAGAYAMEDSPGEAGAIRHRFTVKHIDPSKGSATGYIAKYISKNIDGFTEAGDDIGLDFASGKKASAAAQRVNTWASTWSIRQFQQIVVRPSLHGANCAGFPQMVMSQC
jgi:hypothetical protein